MPLHPRPVVRWNPGERAWETTCRGYSVLSDPRLNKGTAFPESERAALGLTGLLPSRVLTLDQQAQRAYKQCSQQASDLDKNVYLTALHDRNEVLFYRVLTDHLSELLPIVYTPTIGEAIQQYSHQYRRPRGVYLSIDAPDQIETALRATELSAGEVDLIVATDAQAILGIGDWGVGGIDIAAGKLAVYTAAGGVNPARTLPVMLDVGTDRPELLEDPLYLGVRHKRPAQEAYDAFIDAYVTTALKIFPHALLHWEDFGPGNARRILDRYRDHILTFNDDMQGTGAGQHGGEVDRAGALDVVVEGEYVGAVAVQDAPGVAGAEVLPVQERAGEDLQRGGDVGVDEGVVGLLRGTLVLYAQIERVLQQLGPVGADVQDHRQGAGRVDAARGGVDGELARRDVDATDAPVADAEDGLRVGGDDELDLVGGQLGGAQGGLDLVRRIDAEVDAARAAVLVAVVPDGLADRRGVDDGQQLAEVVGEQPEEQDLVAVLQGGQVDVLVEGAGLPRALPVGALGLLVQGQDA